MKTLLLLTMISTLCLALASCALFDQGGLAESAGIIDVTTERIPVLDDQGNPVVNEDGQALVDVVTTRSPGTAVRNVVGGLDGFWGLLATGALSIATAVMGRYAGSKRREAKTNADAAKLLIDAAADADATTSIKTAIKKRKATSDASRRRVAELAAS